MSTPRSSRLFVPAALALAATSFPTTGIAQTVTGATVSVYASSVPGPLRLAFAADGSLYCGRDTAYTGTITPLLVTSIGAGGAPVQPFGLGTTPDPDTVLVDANGSVSGVPGSVLTGGIKVGSTVGSVSAIRPNGTVVELWSSTQWVNPTDLKIDGTGRLLFTDVVSRGIWQSVGGAAPTTLFTLPGSAAPFFLAVAPDQRIFVTDSTGRLYEYAANGTLLNGNVANLGGAASIEFGPGGGFGTTLYALGIGNGTLSTIAANGTVTSIGSGLGNQLGDLAVGADGDLYYSNFSAGQIGRITPTASHQPFGTGCHGPAPLTLTASPAPILNPGTVVTYTISNVPEFVPGSGVHLSTLFLSLQPLPGGLELQGLLTTVPGCRVYLATLDLSLGAAVTAQPSNQVPFLFALPVFQPGTVIAAQAVALFDPSVPLPNGESGGFVLSNGLLSTTQTQ